MSWQATAWALQQRVGQPARKLVLLALANYADEHGICWPSQERLAEDVEMSLDTIQRHTKKLREAGLLTVTRPPKRRGQWQTFVYQLAITVQTTRPQPAARSKHVADHAQRNPERGAGAPSRSPQFSQGPAKAFSDRQKSGGGCVITAADRPLEKVRSFDVRSSGDAGVEGSAAVGVRGAECGLAGPQPERKPGRIAVRPKPSLEPSREPSSAQTTSDAGARLQAFRASHEATEVTQNRIARRLGPEGWLILGELSDAQRDRLTALERRHQLDDGTLMEAALQARSSQPP
ncbi:helix-turn-helix domain-containing protein [Bradyrhizobium sp. A11]|uniref:helix-turn-helix domain-containing protein n=1 Tax=Bradyrhizobium sp. A11 TaxID=3133974 RepID=UPI0035C84E30